MWRVSRGWNIAARAKGPSEVTFRTDAAGTPSLWIAQTNLGIGQAISFPARKAQPPNLSRAVRFAPGTTDLPFGEMLYQAQPSCRER